MGSTLVNSTSSAGRKEPFSRGGRAAQPLKLLSKHSSSKCSSTRFIAKADSGKKPNEQKKQPNWLLFYLQAKNISYKIPLRKPGTTPSAMVSTISTTSVAR